MITKEKAVAAIRAVTSGAERGKLMAFVYAHEEQLHRWGIEESDGDVAIVSFVRHLAVIAGGVAGLGSKVPAAGGGSSSRRPALQTVQLFWQALLALPSIIVGSFLTLPSNVYLLGTMSLGSSLLVRHCYRGIFDRMMQLRSSNRMSRFLITGMWILESIHQGLILQHARVSYWLVGIYIILLSGLKIRSIHPAIRPSSHSSIQPFVHPAIRPSSHSSIQPFVHPAIRPSSHSSIQPCILRRIVAT
ncbi:hypothetical protein Vafri_15549 [Volvox africanus]|uniref:Uncharacterized protein n=1 Tax=Volvox africanus TaxID=51714 RepID=A0A8J4F5M2_9CHLO|nr:hypothetical protein Vafri_15549 [Volvox africanus]